MFSLLSEHTAQGNVCKVDGAGGGSREATRGCQSVQGGSPGAPYVVTVWWKVQSDGRR